MLFTSHELHALQLVQKQQMRHRRRWQMSRLEQHAATQRYYDPKGQSSSDSTPLRCCTLACIHDRTGLRTQAWAAARFFRQLSIEAVAVVRFSLPCLCGIVTPAGMQSSTTSSQHRGKRVKQYWKGYLEDSTIWPLHTCVATGHVVIPAELSCSTIPVPQQHLFCCYRVTDQPLLSHTKVDHHQYLPCNT